MINFKRLALTDIKIDVPRLAKKKVLKEAFTSAGVEHYANLLTRGSSVLCFLISMQRHVAAITFLTVCRPADVEGKFAESSWGKKLEARRKKASLTDLERYKAAVAKTKKSKAVRAAFSKLKKQEA